MKALVPHYKNKYPTARVEWSENHLRVISKDGDLLVSLERGGGGVLLDKQGEHGARDAHDLSPIPKNTRAHKLFADGKLGQAEEHADRSAISKALAEKSEGKILSIDEYRKAGYSFEGDTVVIPVEKAAAPFKNLKFNQES